MHSNRQSTCDASKQSMISKQKKGKIPENKSEANSMMMMRALVALLCCLLAASGQQQVEALQTSILSSIHLQVPSSNLLPQTAASASSQSANPTQPANFKLPTTPSNLSRRDLSAKQTFVGTLYDRQSSSAEQTAARSHQAAARQAQRTVQPGKW